MKDKGLFTEEQLRGQYDLGFKNGKSKAQKQVNGLIGDNLALQSKLFDKDKADLLIDRLRTFYDNNSLDEGEENLILDTIRFLGGEINW